MERQIRDAALRFAFMTLPPPLLQLGLDFAISAVMQRHPAIVERLTPWCGARILIEPQDLPCALLFSIAAPSARLGVRLAAYTDCDLASARVRGPLSRLADLLEGNVDGDALFFARDLSFSGDTEVIVALRNALDGEDIDLPGDLLSALGPLSRPARTVLEAATALASRTGQRGRSRRTLAAVPGLKHGDHRADKIHGPSTGGAERHTCSQG